MGGFKVSGAFAVAEERIVGALRDEMEATQRLTEATLRYPSAQARRSLRELCYSAKASYWMRSQSPAHVAEEQ